MVPEISSTTDKVFCHFRLLFVLLTPVTTWEINILKKIEKTSRGIIILNMSAINKIKGCMISEIWSMTDRILSYFGPFFALLHPLPPSHPPYQPKASKL